MYSASLLPYEYRILHQSARKKDAGLLIAIFAMILLLLVYLIFSFNTAVKVRELNNIKAQNASLVQQITPVDDLEVIKNEVNTLLTQVSSVAGNNPKWDVLIASIGNSVPEMVSLNNIAANYNGETGSCTINGNATNHEAVSLWLKGLSEISGIGEIRCEFSGAAIQEEVSLVQFELTFPILAGTDYQIQVGGSGNESK